MVIVGRDDEAFERSPARLQQTEALVNHVYKLATGRKPDLIFAVRLDQLRKAHVAHQSNSIQRALMMPGLRVRSFAR